jgi:hypothetical protein
VERVFRERVAVEAAAAEELPAVVARALRLLVAGKEMLEVARPPVPS